MTVVYLRADTSTGEVTCADAPPGTEPVRDDWEPEAAAWLAALDVETIEREALMFGGLGDSPLYAALHRVIIPGLLGEGPLHEVRR